MKERIAALGNQLRVEIPAIPYADLDPLSQALVDYAAELTALNGPGRQAVADEAGMTLEAVEQMIRSIRGRTSQLHSTTKGAARQ